MAKRAEFQFDWDEAKATANQRKHGVTFELATSIFADPFLLTVPDEAHSANEERWFSIGRASDQSFLTVAYLWEPGPRLTRVQLISARKATRREIRYYQESE
jgi:uncharacterized protein